MLPGKFTENYFPDINSNLVNFYFSWEIIVLTFLIFKQYLFHYERNVI